MRSHCKCDLTPGTPPALELVDTCDLAAYVEGMDLNRSTDHRASGQVPAGDVENADIGTSSEDYARRFAGAVGRWFVETQSRMTLSLLGSLPIGASILDVGGGHAQIAPPLIEAGYEVTVVGSDPVCSARLQPWLSTNRCRFEVANLQALPFS